MTFKQPAPRRKARTKQELTRERLYAVMIGRTATDSYSLYQKYVEAFPLPAIGYQDILNALSVLRERDYIISKDGLTWEMNSDTYKSDNPPLPNA